MSYEIVEESMELGSPITLYEFRVGPNPADVLLFTDADEQVFHNLKMWKQETIDHSEISMDGTINKQQFTITLPSINEIPQLFLFYPPSYVVTVVVYEGHFLDHDREFITVLQGRVLNSDIQNATATLTCEPASTSTRRNGLRRNYQKQCPLPLYGPDCRAVREEINLSVVSKQQNQFIVNVPVSGLPGTVDMYAAGIISWVDPDTSRTEIRTIIQMNAVAGTLSIVITGPIANLPDFVTVLRGCDHTENSCATRHNNLVNYGGQLWIPLENPVGKISTYF
jgi:hypothetical protein